MGGWSGINCFMPRRDLKGAAMFWFAPASAQGQNREPGLQENPVRDFTERQIPPSPPVKKHPQGCFFMGRWSGINCFMPRTGAQLLRFLFTFWILRKPSLFYPLFLLKQFQNTPPARKPRYRKSPRQYLARGNQGPAQKHNSRHSKKRPDLFGKIVFRFNNNRMEQPNNQKSQCTHNQALPIHTRPLCKN